MKMFKICNDLSSKAIACMAADLVHVSDECLMLSAFLVAGCPTVLPPF